MRGLVVKSPYIEDILNGNKKIEIRGSSTIIRGKIVLLKSVSGKAIGTVEIYGCEKWSLDDYNNWDYRKDNGKLPVNKLPYKNTYAWILINPEWFDDPKPYKHPSGAIVWVNLSDDFLGEKHEN